MGHMGEEYTGPLEATPSLGHPSFMLTDSSYICCQRQLKMQTVSEKQET